MSERLEALHQLIAWARGDHICKRCNGEGELYFDLSRHFASDPQMDDYAECPDCGGTGEVPVS
jgi:DnaJ-class molecular chaperone